MQDQLQLNVALLRRRVPNLTSAAKHAGLRAATVSNLCTGKIPISRAEVRTLATLASLANCTMDELIIRGSGVRMMETGIKAVDLFAPIVRGGTVGIVARPNIGQLVLLSELFRRVKQREYVTVFWKPEGEASGLNLVEQEAEIICSSLEDLHREIAAVHYERDVMLGADRSIVLSGDLLKLRERLKEAGGRPVTTILVDILGEAADEDSPYGPLDTLMRLDLDMAARKLFPAIDPVISTSTVLEGAQLEASHLMIQQRARKMLRRYRELRSLAALSGMEGFVESDAQTYHRGERLEAFLSQPFYVSEPFTKKSGEWLPLQETLDGARRIMDGAADDRELQELVFTGRLDK